MPAVGRLWPSNDDDDDDDMIGHFSGTSDWWTVGTLLIIAVSLQPPTLPALP